jgi:hypothetical protein
MILLEIALAVVLVWLLASCSLILGGCISACVLRPWHQRPLERLVLHARYDPYAQKSDLYVD